MSTSDDKQGKNTSNIIKGIENSGTMRVSGNVTVTIKDVSQSIAAIPNADDDEKEKLRQLIMQLQDALKTVPSQYEADAKLVATRTEQLAQEASQETVDQEEVAHKANKLRQAAEKLKDAMPVVLAVATQIVGHIVKSGMQ